ncbi:ANTAR domain-containing protein [Streptomyces umbrinus]|uniref:ANTAR domain-containing protein n=1 Tax=Streptomyces umbrinus TaxID=67370 RepID=UPI00341AD891
MRYRSGIDQALGVAMRQRKCTAEAAFDILRSASPHRNIKLRDLRTELITNLTGRPPTAPELRPRP